MFLCPWDSLGKNTGVGCHALLQGIFLIQGSNPCLSLLLHLHMGSLPLAPPRKPHFLYQGVVKSRKPNKFINKEPSIVVFKNELFRVLIKKNFTKKQYFPCKFYKMCTNYWVLSMSRALRGVQAREDSKA